MPDIVSRAWEPDSDSDLESTNDVTQLYTYGELEDEWSDTMEMDIPESESMDKALTT